MFHFLLLDQKYISGSSVQKYLTVTHFKTIGIKLFGWCSYNMQACVEPHQVSYRLYITRKRAFIVLGLSSNSVCMLVTEFVFAYWNNTVCFFLCIRHFRNTSASSGRKEYHVSAGIKQEPWSDRHRCETNERCVINIWKWLFHFKLCEWPCFTSVQCSR
jgi:hypothetical protein